MKDLLGDARTYADANQGTGTSFSGAIGLWVTQTWAHDKIMEAFAAGWDAKEQAKREVTDDMVDEFCNNFQPQEGNCGTTNIGEIRERVRRGLKAALDV